MSGQTLTEMVMEQTGLTRTESTRYMDDLEELHIIARKMPGASWDAGAWLLTEDGERLEFAGPLSD